MYNLKTAIIMMLFICIVVFMASSQAAGGIVLGSTRVIYHSDLKQTGISVRNTSEKSRYMVQSWMENEQGDKTTDFIVTPPLYVSNPGSENVLRLMYAGAQLPGDRETMFYLTAKAIPAVDTSQTEGRNILMFAAATRIKVIYRPKGFSILPDKAPEMLTASRNGQQVIIKNPTPYYITLAQVTIGGQSVAAEMIPPKGQIYINVSTGTIDTLRFRTINDFGGMTEEMVRKL